MTTHSACAGAAADATASTAPRMLSRAFMSCSSMQARLAAIDMPAGIPMKDHANGGWPSSPGNTSGVTLSTRVDIRPKPIDTPVG